MSIFEGFNRRYHEEMQEKIDYLGEIILKGNIADFVDYKRLVGQRTGLLEAVIRHKELLTLMDNANDN